MLKNPRADTAPVQTPEVYNFGPGLEEVARRAKALFDNQEYVVVGVCSTGKPDLGKTFISKSIWGALTSEEVEVVDFQDLQLVNRLSVENAMTLFKTKPRKLVLFSCLGTYPKGARDLVNEALKKVGDAANMPGLAKFDILVLLDRPDSQIEESQSAGVSELGGYEYDLHIRNEKASDKPESFKAT